MPERQSAQVHTYASGARGASVGYWFARTAWGRGYATEAARALVAHGFDELGLDRVVGHHFVENPASGRVLAKLGFAEMAYAAPQTCAARGGEALPTRALSLTREAWEAGAAEPAGNTRVAAAISS